MIYTVFHEQAPRVMALISWQLSLSYSPTKLAMPKLDVRWIQRVQSFSKALQLLTKFIDKGELNELEAQGLIQAFEYTYESAGNTIKDYFEAQGEVNIHGSRDALRLAFKRDLITDGEGWMEMIKSRALSVHTYDEEIAEKVVKDIKEKYFLEFMQRHKTLKSLQEDKE